MGTLWDRRVATWALTGLCATTMSAACKKDEGGSSCGDETFCYPAESASDCGSLDQHFSESCEDRGFEDCGNHFYKKSCAPTPTGAKKKIGPEGGRLVLQNALFDVELDIPAGALEETIELGIDGIHWQQDTEDLAARYVMTPHGTEFLADVALKIGIDAPSVPENVVVVTRSNDGTWDAPLTAVVTSEGGASVASANIQHFSSFGLQGNQTEHSFCSLPLKGGPTALCTKAGKSGRIAWAVYEHGLTDRQPDVTFIVDNLSEDIVIPEYFEVTNGENMDDSRGLYGQGTDELTRFDLAMPPSDYGKKSWRAKVAASSEPRKRFWRWYDRTFWVHPANDRRVMAFDWCFGYRLADGKSEKPVCGHYEGPPLSTCTKRCERPGELGECDEGETCSNGCCEPPLSCPSGACTTYGSTEGCSVGDFCNGSCCVSCSQHPSGVCPGGEAGTTSAGAGGEGGAGAGGAGGTAGSGDRCFATYYGDPAGTQCIQDDIIPCPPDYSPGLCPTEGVVGTCWSNPGTQFVVYEGADLEEWKYTCESTEGVWSEQ